jgi:hypothetical protein
MSKNIRTIIIAVAAILILFAGYSFFVKKDEPSVTLSTEPVQGAEGNVGREFLAVLLDLKSVELDEAIFETESFKQLEDWSSILSPEPVGRRNPFAPLSAGAMVALPVVKTPSAAVVR